VSASGPAPAVAVSPEEFLRLGREVLQAQSFGRLLGWELTRLSPGEAELQLTIDDRLLQQNGFAHGGVVSALADNALTFAGGTAMRVPVVTSEMKVNYLRPAIGERLVARARAVHVGRSQAVCICEVFAVKDGREKLCALAQGTIAQLAAPPAPKAPDGTAPDA